MFFSKCACFFQCSYRLTTVIPVSSDVRGLSSFITELKLILILIFMTSVEIESHVELIFLSFSIRCLLPAFSASCSHSLSSFCSVSHLRGSLTPLSCELVVSSLYPPLSSCSASSLPFLNLVPFNVSHKQCVRCMTVTWRRRQPIKSRMFYYFTLAFPSLQPPEALQLI